MGRVSENVLHIQNGLYDKGYRRGRVYEDRDVTITAYLNGRTVLLLQTFRDRHTGEEEYGCLYKPVVDSIDIEEIIDTIPHEKE